jgi:ribonuclease HII
MLEQCVQPVKKQKVVKQKLKSAPKDIERELLDCGYRYLIGVDECGVGSLAGPITVCAAHVPLEVDHGGVRDSKTLSAVQRDEAYKALHGDERVKKQIVFFDHIYVDNHNNLQTRLDGMTKSVEQLIVQERVLERFKLEEVCVLIDGNAGPHELTSKYACRLIVRGDAHSYAIGAASNLAKVTRDRYMDMLHPQFPEYEWNKNKGYPSDGGKHMTTVRAMGNSVFHRRSFTPCNQVALSKHAKEWLKEHKHTDPEFSFAGYETPFTGIIPKGRDTSKANSKWARSQRNSVNNSKLDNSSEDDVASKDVSSLFW